MCQACVDHEVVTKRVSHIDRRPHGHIVHLLGADSPRQDDVILSGRVGSKQVHDVAVRTAIDVGYPFRDDLVIDTGLAHAVAQSASAVMTAGGQGVPGTQSASPYVY